MFIDKSFSVINTDAVEDAMKEKWHGKTFSKRITNNNDEFAEKMQNIFVSEMAQGKSINHIAQTISAEIGIRLDNAKRIARTEANRYLSNATFEGYKNAGIEEYIFLATLDYKTSTLCQELDMKVFKVEDRQIGLNCNPMHPNCRSTTCAKLDVDIDTRVARGIDGKSYEVSGNMNYKEWWNSLTEQERDKMEFLKKSYKNKKRDKEQYNRLKKKLGTKAPRSFKEFQRLKYQEREKLAEIKQLSNRQRSGKIKISGAITDEDSNEATKHAEKMYGQIRKRKTDVKRIAQNTGYSEEQIEKIKKYLFVDEHLLDGEIKQFAPDFSIAQSWDRLFYGNNIQPHDLLLLKHEIMEMELKEKGLSHQDAHDLTNKTYNYQKGCVEYYDLLKKSQKRRK